MLQRFLNPERMALHKLPDIDIDFAHDRKDDVVQLLFDRHGRERCAVVGGFSTFQARSAFAEVAKVLGVSERDVRKFTEHFPWGFGGGWVPDQPAPKGGAEFIERLRANPETRGLPLEEEPYKTAVEMAAFLDGMPRYPKMHPCGVVLSCQPMHELTPTFISNKGLPTTHYDMDAVESIGLVKMDILAQGGLAVIRDTKGSLAKLGVSVDLEALEPWNDPQVWEMIASGGARAVHHIESPSHDHTLPDDQRARDRWTDRDCLSHSSGRGQRIQGNSRRYQAWSRSRHPHPSLEPCSAARLAWSCMRSISCKSARRLPDCRRAARISRRALVKQKHGRSGKLVMSSSPAPVRGHAEPKIAEVWQLQRLLRLRLQQGAQHGLGVEGISGGGSSGIIPPSSWPVCSRTAKASTIRWSGLWSATAFEAPATHRESSGPRLRAMTIPSASLSGR